MDRTLERLINVAWTHPALDRLMAAASSFDLWLPFIVLAIVLTAWRGGPRARWFLATLALTLTISDGLVAASLKRAVHRPRPFQKLAWVRQIDLARHARPRLLALVQPLEVMRTAPTRAETAAAERSEGRSFPSSHTMNNFCTATLLAFFYRRRGWWYFLPASVVAYSRVYVGSHWPSDVVASAMMATALALGIALLVQYGRRRWLPPKTACPLPPAPLLL